MGTPLWAHTRGLHGKQQGACLGFVSCVQEVADALERAMHLYLFGSHVDSLLVHMATDQAKLIQVHVRCFQDAWRYSFKASASATIGRFIRNGNEEGHAVEEPNQW